MHQIVSIRKLIISQEKITTTPYTNAFCLMNIVSLTRGLTLTLEQYMEPAFQSSEVISYFFPSKPFNHPYYMDSTTLQIKSTHRDLGVVMSENLRWNEHYQSMLAKAYKLLGRIRTVFASTYCPLAKKVLYIYLIRSKITYCSPVWRPYLLVDIRTLESIQRRATKFVLNDFHSSYCHRLTELDLLPLMMIFEINDILFFIKQLKSPSEHFNISTLVSFCSGQTRSATHFKMKFHPQPPIHLVICISIVFLGFGMLFPSSTPINQ